MTQNRREFLAEVCVGVVSGAAIVTLNAAPPDKKRFTTTILTVDVPNKNNRIYPKEVVKKSIEQLGDSPLLGCIGFQDGTIKVPFSLVSHQATNLKLVGDELQADITILDTDEGKQLQKMLRQNQIAFRTGGVGDYQREGGDGPFVIDKGFKFTTVAALPAKDAS